MATQRDNTFSPSVLMSDFESGTIPVIKSEVRKKHQSNTSNLILQFPSSKHHGCLFHFTQALYRQIQQLGLQQEYLNNEAVRTSCKTLMTLSVMPKEVVIDSYHQIKNRYESIARSKT